MYCKIKSLLLFSFCSINRVLHAASLFIQIFLIFLVCLLPQRNHSSLTLLELFISMNILTNYGCCLWKLSLPQPWGWSHPCPGCAEPRLQERTGNASQLGQCRERGMLMSRTSLSRLSCRASSVVGFENKIHAEMLNSKKKKHAPEKLLKVVLILELKECIFSVRNNWHGVLMHVHFRNDYRNCLPSAADSSSPAERWGALCAHTSVQRAMSYFNLPERKNLLILPCSDELCVLAPFFNSAVTSRWRRRQQTAGSAYFLNKH